MRDHYSKVFTIIDSMNETILHFIANNVHYNAIFYTLDIKLQCMMCYSRGHLNGI